jgi:hypothetical protein
MHEWKVGETVWIPCEIREGAFPGENLIICQTVDQEISGFVSDSELDKKSSRVRAIVAGVINGKITVRFRGDFFTTAGLADISSQAISA